MFGIDGIEFLIILIVIVVVVGPKDLPKMMRAFGQATARMRRTATEFHRHFDEAMREAELDDIADTVKGVTKLDPRKNLTEIFDPIRNVTNDIKASLAEPVSPSSAPPPVPPLDATGTEAAIEKKDSPKKGRPKAVKKTVTKQKAQAVDPRVNQSKNRSQTKKNMAKKADEAS